MDKYEKNYNLSFDDSFVSLQTDVENLFRCYMDLMRAFALGAGDSVIDHISSDFVIWYETYRTKYGEPFVEQMRGSLVPKLIGGLEQSFEISEGQLPDDPRKKQAILAVASGTLQLLRVFEASGMNFEELSEAMGLWAKLRKKHNK